MSRRRVAISILPVLLSALGCTDDAVAPGATARPAATSSSLAGDPPEPSKQTREPAGLQGTQQRWDPRDVHDLPAAPPGTVPGLPEVLDPPGSSIRLASAPTGAALVAIEQAGQVQLLAVSGEWRSVELPRRSPAFALSPLGTKLLVRRVGGAGPVVVHDLATGVAHEIGIPHEFEPVDYPSWTWLDDSRLLLDAADGGFAIDAMSGEAARVPYPSASASYWSPDPEGMLVDSSDWGSPPVLTDWAPRPARTVSMRVTGRLMHLRVDETTVVGTSYDRHPFAVIVADRETLEPAAVLPVLDFEGNYSPGALRPVALQEDGSVLLRVSVFGRNVEGFRLVVWEPDSGELSVASSVGLPIERSVEFAEGLLRRTDP